MKVVTSESVVNAAVLVVAQAVRDVAPLTGCGRRDLIDQVASASLAKHCQLHLRGLNGISWMSEGKKDRSYLLEEGQEFGSFSDIVTRIAIGSDPVECTGELARPKSKRRGSTCVLSLAPADSVPWDIYSGCYALKVILPKGTPVGGHGITIDTPPRQLVKIMLKTFKRAPSDFVVWILDRSRHRRWIKEFEETGVNVQTISSGDLEAHMLAGSVVQKDRPVHISFGIGGLPEGFLVVPHLRATGAHILLKPDPEKKHYAEIKEAGCLGMLDRVYDRNTMISSDDCLILVGGITDTQITRGIRYDNGDLRVTVFVASPAFRFPRYFEVTFDTGMRVDERTQMPVSNTYK